MGLSMGSMFAQSGQLAVDAIASAPSSSWIRGTMVSVKPETLFAMLDGALGSTQDDLKSRHISSSTRRSIFDFVVLIFFKNYWSVMLYIKYSPASVLCSIT